MNRSITYQFVIFNNPIKVSEESVNFGNETGRARNLDSLTFNLTDSVLEINLYWTIYLLPIYQLPCIESHVSDNKKSRQTSIILTRVLCKSANFHPDFTKIPFLKVIFIF